MKDLRDSVVPMALPVETAQNDTERPLPDSEIRNSEIITRHQKVEDLMRSLRAKIDSLYENSDSEKTEAGLRQVVNILTSANHRVDEVSRGFESVEVVNKLDINIDSLMMKIGEAFPGLTHSLINVLKGAHYIYVGDLLLPGDRLELARVRRLSGGSLRLITHAMARRGVCPNMKREISYDLQKLYTERRAKAEANRKK